MNPGPPATAAIGDDESPNSDASGARVQVAPSSETAMIGRGCAMSQSEPTATMRSVESASAVGQKPRSAGVSADLTHSRPPLEVSTTASPVPERVRAMAT